MLVNRQMSSTRFTLISVVASLSSTDITVTGITTGDVSSGVYGVEYSVNSVPGIYTFSLNTPGAVASQTININLASEGIVTGDTVYIRAYYNLDALDGLSTRVYATPTLTAYVTAQFMLPGFGYINIVGLGTFMLPGVGYINL